MNNWITSHEAAVVAAAGALSGLLTSTLSAATNGEIVMVATTVGAAAHLVQKIAEAVVEQAGKSD